MDVLDESRFADLRREFPPAAVAALVQTFLSSTPAIVERIVLAADDGNLEEVGHAAHRLKGGCLTVGAGRLHELSGRLEVLAGDPDTPADGLRDCAARLETAWTETRSVLRSRIAV